MRISYKKLAATFGALLLALVCAPSSWAGCAPSLARPTHSSWLVSFCLPRQACIQPLRRVRRFGVLHSASPNLQPKKGLTFLRIFSPKRADLSQGYQRHMPLSFWTRPRRDLPAQNFPGGPFLHENASFASLFPPTKCWELRLSCCRVRQLITVLRKLASARTPMRAGLHG